MNQFGDENLIPQKKRLTGISEELAVLTARNPLSVFSVSWWENRRPWFVTPRRVADHFCLFVVSGKLRMETERGSKELEPGDWCLLKIGELHAFGLADGCNACSHLILHARPKHSLLRDPAELLNDPFFRFRLDETPFLRDMCAFYEWNREGGCAFFSAFLNAKLLGLVPDSGRWRKLPEKTSNEHVAVMCRFAELNCRSRIGIGDLAAAAGIGEAQCRRLFGRYLHCSPSEHLLKVRLFSAARELREGTKSVKEIALDYAFASPSHFCSVFRKKMNRTPEEYRKLP